MNSILSFITLMLPLALKVINWWVQKKATEQKMLDSWYNFLKMADQTGLVKVKNLLSSEQSLDKLKERVRKRRDNEINQNRQDDVNN